MGIENEDVKAEQKAPETEEANVPETEEVNVPETEEAEAVQSEPEAEAKEDKKEHKKEKKEKKDKKDEKIAELNDMVLRQRAEFVNFRNRTEKEKSQMFEVGARNILERILPVIDNFERGLATLSEEERNQPFAQGIEKTYKQLMTALTEAGVEPIEAVGKEFDPNLHNAVMHVEDDSLGENVVAEELQKGYRYRETVIRHSMVKVAN